MRATVLILPILLGGLGFTASDPEPVPLPGPVPETAVRSEAAAAAVWGSDGHQMAARTAAAGLPGSMPEFFLEAGPMLAYLNPEPDRWRSRTQIAMDQAWNYGHYIDLENIPEGSGALSAEHRYEFLRTLYEAGVERPEQSVGFLPYRTLELYQRLVAEWRLWRAAPPGERAWVEMRILNDAGILGHYATDASQPHHTTIHYNGWDSDAPNPRGYTYARDFHGRFESDFVSAHIEQSEVDAAAEPGVRSVVGAAREAIWDQVEETHGLVEALYELEQAHGFDPDAASPHPELEAFAAERLAAGADMLRTLWWSAWLESAEPEPEG